MTSAAPAANSPVAPRRRWPLGRSLRALLWLVLTLLLMLVLALGFVLGTRSGLQWALATAQELAPGVLSVGRAEGRLLGRLELAAVTVRLPGFELALGEGVLDWSPAALLTGRLRINELTGRDVDIGLAPSTKDKSLTLPEIHLPLGIDLRRGLVERLRWRTLGAPPESALLLERLELSAAALAERLDVRRLSARLDRPDLSADASGQVRLLGDYPMTLDLAWRFAGPASSPGAAATPLVLTGKGQVRGDLAALDLELGMDGSLQADLSARLRDLLTSPGWDATLTVQRLDLPALLPGAPDLALNAELASRGTLQDAELTGSLIAEGAVVGRLTANLALRLADQVLELQALQLRQGEPTEAGGPRLDLSSTVGLADLANPVLELRGDWADLRWPLTGPPQVRLSKGALTASGDLSGLDLTVASRVQAGPLPDSELQLTARGSRERIDLTALTLDTLAGRLSLTGALDLVPDLAWQLALTGQGLNPGLLQPGLDGRLDLAAESQGNLTAGFGFQARAEAALQAWPEAALRVAGTGTSAALNLDSLTLETLGGRLDGRGRVELVPTLAWDLVLTLAGLDPGRLAPDWPGLIDGRLAAQGHLTPSGPDLTLDISEVGGQLRGFPVRLDADLALAAGVLTIHRLSAGAGDTRLDVSGQAADPLALEFALQSPDLAALLPGARGRLAATGRVGGTAALPTLNLTLDATDLGLAENGLGRLSGELNAGLARDAPLRLDLRGADLTAGGQHFDALTLTAEGSLAQHRVNAELAGAPLQAQLALTGSFGAAGAWRGDLQRLDLAPAGVGPLTLQRPPGLSFADGRITAAPLCLTDGRGSSACVGFEQSVPGRFTATLDAPRIDLALLGPWLPATLRPEGFLRAAGRFATSDGRLTGNGRVTLPEAALQLQLADHQERLVLNGAQLDLDAGASGLTGRLALPVADLGRVGAEATLPGFTATAPLRGRITAQVNGFDRLAPLVPDVTGLSGRLDADLRLGGTLAAPSVGGELALRGVGLRVPLIGLEVQGFEFIASGRGADAFTLAGGGLVGGRRLDLTGSAAGLLGGQPALTLNLRGDRLKVADTSEYFALVSADLAATLGAEGLLVSGELRIPEARLMPRGVAAGAVQQSPDVILMGDEPQGPPLPLTLDVLARLGDKVQIEAFGLRGRLTGDLRVVKRPGEELTGAGQLAVVDGTFRVSLPGLGLITAIGRPLKIEQGIVNFAGTSLTDPGLVLNAVRQGGDLTAGVQVLGTLRNPKLAFFSDSDPNMSQAEITKYLVTGIPPRRDGDAADERSVSFGTYIAPRLFVEYETGLGDQSDRVKLRYDLNNRVELQTETSSSGQGGDIFFKWEN